VDLGVHPLRDFYIVPISANDFYECGQEEIGEDVEMLEEIDF
jgi:hypothetical protein